VTSPLSPGQHGTEGARINGGDQGSVVRVGTAGIVSIRALTLTGGRGVTTTTRGSAGGGVLCDLAAATLALSNVDITANSANYYGGAWFGSTSATVVSLTGVAGSGACTSPE
jgi:hypothetical protein